MSARATWVPPMADSAAVLAGITRRTRRLLQRPDPQPARAAGADEPAIFADASEGLSRANQNCSVAESIDRFRP